MVGEEKYIAAKSSTNRLQKNVCQLKKQESERVLKAFQGIGVTRQTFLRIWEMAEKENIKKETTLNNFPIDMLSV